MTNDLYSITNLYTLALQLSRVVEQTEEETSYPFKLSNALKACYDNGVQLNVIQTLMLQAWKLLLLKDFFNETEEIKSSNLLLEMKINEFIDSIKNLGIQEVLKKQLNYEQK